jgi:adenine-specific DNA methylase
MADKPRLIERAFPLKQASLDSVHEKNVRHGHISTLHIWPARRPLAACRAALIATLLPDPGTPEERQKLCERIGGKVVQRIEKKKMPDGRTVERIKEETEGGILHWQGSEPTSGDRKAKEEYRRKAKFYEEELEWFRREIRKAYGGRPPRVLDPFAGGGSIPLEAMRLGCEVTAVDLNPVAWFILKCTLEYPQKLAGKTHPLPDFILEDEEFMAAFYKAHTELAMKDKRSERKGDTRKLFAEKEREPPPADLAWHVRAWGKWVLDRARRDLAKFYPTYADFEPLKPGKAYERQPMRLVPLTEDGTADTDALNAEFTAEYLADPRNPRWVAKPTVAYLWARTLTCKNCRATVPLLKTRWLCKKANKRVLLTMEPNADKSGVVFGIETDVPVKGGNAAQRREHDKRIGAGTMSRAGAQCPCCNTIMTMEDIRLEGRAGRLGAVMTAVVVDGQNGKEYRLPTAHETRMAEEAERFVPEVFAQIPFGLPEEPTPKGGIGASRAFSVDGYGFDQWYKLFTPRQLLALGTFVKHTRTARSALDPTAYTPEWGEGISMGLAVGVDRIADRQSTVCRWDMGYTKLQGTFTRFALPITWDYCEGNPLSATTGNYLANLEWVAEYWDHAIRASAAAPPPRAKQSSAIARHDAAFDVVVTDPPYYDAIPYSDLMDFFYVWLRRTLDGLSPELVSAFRQPLSPKWDHEARDGELIDDASRHGGDKARSKAVYEEGMGRAFQACANALKPDGKMVVVFANKQPDAWETLVSAIIRAGFTVDASWPIQTEMGNRTRALSSAALASSVWLVCKKRPATARPGWDNQVLQEMRANITARLREFWDAGIRGPDFVWAATGPALEAYSKHPVVKKANDPGKTMEVSEFLAHVRRMVVDFVVGRVLTGDLPAAPGAAQAGGDGADLAAADRLDAPTAYYLLHRHDFGLEEAPSGACILYATACGLSDSELESTWDILVRTGGSSGDQDEEEEDEEADPDAEADPDSASDSGLPAEDSAQAGSKVKLKTWAQRNRKSMGYEAPGGQPVPLIDRIHRLMHLWRAGDVLKVDEYLDDHGLRRHELFRRLLQSLIELSPAGSDERTLLESLSNHVQAKGAKPEDRQATLAFGEET